MSQHPRRRLDPKLPPTDASGAPAAAETGVLNWGRFLVAQTDQELECLAMADPDMRAAKAALDRLSADPRAQRLAEERELAQWNYERTIRLSREEGEAKGEAALRVAVQALCEVLQIPITADRELALRALDLTGLETLAHRLKTERHWPE